MGRAWQRRVRPRADTAAACLQEDSKVRELVAKFGPKKWSVIAADLPGRVGKQCRERCAPRQRRAASSPAPARDRPPPGDRRWQNHLCPDIKKDPWSDTEEQLLIKVHR